MLFGLKVLFTSFMSAFTWAIVLIYAADNVHPTIMTYAHVTEGSPMWGAVVALEAFIAFILFIPWIIAGFGLVGFVSRVINKERAEWDV
jgi:hypothetical protein